MSGEDDTFEIDIYGDDDQNEQQQQQEQQEDDQLQWDEGAGDQEQGYGYDGVNDAHDGQAQNGSGADWQQTQGQGQAGDSPAVQQGTKRKAPDDDADTSQTFSNGHNGNAAAGSAAAGDTRPIDPGAMPALKLAELYWWTNEEDLRAYTKNAGVEDEIREVAFGEHKINGKSRGEAYLEFASPQAATLAKREVDKAISGENGGKKLPFTIFFTPVGNPFKAFQKDATGPAQGVKGNFNKFNNQGGAYNNNNFSGGRGGRGGFQNRGGFNNGYSRGGGMQGNWGMNNSGNFGNSNFNNGGFTNPMMGNMGGYGMARGGMMGNMMGRGGFGGMGMNGMNGMNNMGMMGNMMGMGARGGMMGGGGRGGWGGGGGGGNGGFQQQGYGGGYQQDANKKMRTE